MNALTEQFLAESREALDEIAQKLLALEEAPSDADLLTQLFRLVHTLKGNCGLFDLPEMARVLHAGEDLMSAVRNGTLAFNQRIADQLLDAMDFVRILCDEMEAERRPTAEMMGEAVTLANALRNVLGQTEAGAGSSISPSSSSSSSSNPKGFPSVPDEWLARLPQALQLAAAQAAAQGTPWLWLHYTPAEECFFQGDDPLHQARLTPGVVWGGIAERAAWPALEALDAYRCQLDFDVLSTASAEEISAHFRYVPDQVQIYRLVSESAPAPASAQVAADALPQPHVTQPHINQALLDVLAAQREILALPNQQQGLNGRLAATTVTLQRCLLAAQREADLPGLQMAADQASQAQSSAPLAAWLAQAFPVGTADSVVVGAPSGAAMDVVGAAKDGADRNADVAARTSRRSEDAGNAKTLRVEQEKIDRLMNLIGEMVVARNALPYLASRAETVYGERELAREIKSQHAVIHRISEEMQDAIMQIRMMPVSFIFQRFPRLVRDTSRRLGKDVQLVLEGEGTAADKNVIESLGDPLVHIVRNSLDHGLEAPDVREAMGKSRTGLLKIVARQDADRVLIEIADDGRGIDPEVVKRKAYQNGLIDEAALARMTDEEAVNLIFLPGFSTAEAVSDLSGRGVGMDVVRTAIERVNGSIHLHSVKGQGTVIQLSLPLSMAVSTVMTVETDGQKFGVPMNLVEETMRIPRSALRGIKQQLTAVVRGRIVPLRSLNRLLGLASEPMANEDDLLAVLVLRIGGGLVGILVDDFHQTADIILKPMTGVLGNLRGYSGSALMGDGSVLMVLNMGEMLA